MHALSTYDLPLPIHQMIHLYQDPKGEKVFKNTNPSCKTDEKAAPRSSIPGLKDEESITYLQSRVQEMEKEMQKKDKRISELESYVNWFVLPHQL